ncbi:MAG: hypothetical protein O3A00_23660 [Planctomycetota bacterium]|nr:hypothetical protein [Planctomycetota bacterium]
MSRNILGADPVSFYLSTGCEFVATFAVIRLLAANEILNFDGSNSPNGGHHSGRRAFGIPHQSMVLLITDSLRGQMMQGAMPAGRSVDRVIQLDIERIRLKTRIRQWFRKSGR